MISLFASIIAFMLSCACFGFFVIGFVYCVYKVLLK
jgi:hypothetical protein